MNNKEHNTIEAIKEIVSDKVLGLKEKIRTVFTGRKEITTPEPITQQDIMKFIDQLIKELITLTQIELTTFLSLGTGLSGLYLIMERSKTTDPLLATIIGTTLILTTPVLGWIGVEVMKLNQPHTEITQ